MYVPLPYPFLSLMPIPFYQPIFFFLASHTDLSIQFPLVIFRPVCSALLGFIQDSLYKLPNLKEITSLHFNIHSLKNLKSILWSNYRHKFQAFVFINLLNTSIFMFHRNLKIGKFKSFSFSCISTFA